jgi:hypothetical protein
VSELNRTTTKLVLARSISSFGSSFSDFVLPLFIFEVTKSPSLLATQWAINALSKVMSGKIAGRFHILKNNKQAIILLDFLQGVSALLPLLFWQTHPTIGTFLSGVLISFFMTIQVGYIESSIFKMTESFPDCTAIRSSINASLENGKYIGQFLGYLFAWLCSMLVGYKLAILVDSLTFMISGVITLAIVDNSTHKLSEKVKESFSLLFDNRKITLLTISQCFLSFAIFIYNSSFTYMLKGPFQVTDGTMAVFLVSQAITYILGSHRAKKIKVLSNKWHFNLRAFYFVIFTGFFLAKTFTEFMILNCLLSILISFTQPKIVAIFQSFTTSQNSRSFGASRVSLMAISGLVGSVFCAVFAKTGFDYQLVFLVAACACAASVLFFKKFIRSSEVVTSLIKNQV